MEQPSPPTLYLTTCGTSSLTKRATPEERALMVRCANATEAELDAQTLERLRGLAERATRDLCSADTQTLRSASAELNGLLGALDGAESPRTQHVVIGSDTFLGALVVNLTREVLEGRDQPVLAQIVPELQTSDIGGFRRAMDWLTEWAATTLAGYRARGWRVVFNLTGGFKSVNGYLQTLGTMYADEVVFVFEGQTDLLRIPRLPIQLDLDAVRPHFYALRRLALDLPAETAPLPRALVYEVGDERDLSFLGRFVLEELKKQTYPVALQQPLSPRVQVSAKLAKSVEKLEGQRRRLINARIDELSRFVETGKMLRSLDFKALRGNPVPGSTHECDAWSDVDARRLIAHYEGSTLVVDDLITHL